LIAASRTPRVVVVDPYRGVSYIPSPAPPPPHRQLTILALSVSAASAFVAPAATSSQGVVKATKDEVVALAEANPE
jgi:hypothetical protein